MKVILLKPAIAFFLGSLLLTAIPATAPAQTAQAEPTFDVRNGDQQGKLVVGDAELAFESLTDSRHSRRWKYADVRELSKKGKKEFRVRPHKGSRYDFQLKQREERDKIYDLISARLLAARRQAK